MKTIAIRKEDKNHWERRTPLTPQTLIKHQNEKIKFIVQPSQNRIYTDSDYLAAEATLTESLSDADTIIGVKEMPESFFEQNKTYMFFSHTIKGQSHNMQMLKKMMDLKCNLIDFECITDQSGKRLVFFGRHAGLAGMIDGLHALGKRFEALNYQSVFSKVKMAYEYLSIDKAFAELKTVAQEASKEGFIKSLNKPLVFGFTGYGNVSKGAQEIFDIFEHITISPKDLLNEKTTLPTDKLIKVVFTEKETIYCEAINGYEATHFQNNPQKYSSIFNKYLPKLTGLINCIYWEPNFPRLLTLQECHKLYAESFFDGPLVIADLSCDINGSIECTFDATSPDNPYYIYDIDKKRVKYTAEGKGPVIMAVDNLPCELPKDASDSFSEALEPFLPELGSMNSSLPLAQSGLSKTMQKAVILWNGQLTPNFKYIEQYL